MALSEHIPAWIDPLERFWDRNQNRPISRMARPCLGSTRRLSELVLQHEAGLAEDVLRLHRNPVRGKGMLPSAALSGVKGWGDGEESRVGVASEGWTWMD